MKRLALLLLLSTSAQAQPGNVEDQICNGVIARLSSAPALTRDQTKQMMCDLGRLGSETCRAALNAVMQFYVERYATAEEINKRAPDLRCN